MKAYIKQEDNKTLWLIVDRSEKEDIDFSFTEDFNYREEDDKRGVAYPILEDEIAEIMRACYEYLEEKKGDADVFKD